MIIGHIPAGYIVSKLTYGRASGSIGDYRAFLWWSICGAIAPDLDLLYFYFLERGHIQHHEYFTHYPSVWLSLIILSIAFFTWKAKRRSLGCYLLVFSVSGFLHLILDTIGGSIWWLAPLGDHPFSLTQILPRLHVWRFNFPFHLSFLFELVLVAWAVWLWPRNHKPLPDKVLTARSEIENHPQTRRFDFPDRSTAPPH